MAKKENNVEKDALNDPFNGEYFEDQFDESDDFDDFDEMENDSTDLLDALMNAMGSDNKKQKKDTTPKTKTEAELANVNKILRQKYKQLEEFEVNYENAIHNPTLETCKSTLKDIKTFGPFGFAFSGVGLITGGILGLTGVAILPVVLPIVIASFGLGLFTAVGSFIIEKIEKRKIKKFWENTGLDKNAGKKLKEEIKALEEAKNQLQIKQQEEKAIIQSAEKQQEKTQNTVKQPIKTQENTKKPEENKNVIKTTSEKEVSDKNSPKKKIVYRNVTNISNINGSVITRGIEK